MIFSIPRSEPKITKEFLLSKNTEETYMRTYLGLPIKRGLQISPLRNDKRPTASFYRNKNNELIFHDFGIGFHENFIGVVMYLNKCDYRKALHIIAEDFGYVEKPSDRELTKVKKCNVILEEKGDTSIQITPKAFSEQELKWWESFGITENTLKKFKVFSCDSVFLNGNYFGSPSAKSYIFGYYGGKRNDLELWRIYFPQKKAFRFLSNWSKNMMQGARQLPRTGDYLCITKSLKDVMVLYELGIPAIAPCSEVLFLTNLQLDKLTQRFKHVFVFYDNDRAGISNMFKIKKKHPNLKYIWIPTHYQAKDISDFVKKYGVEKTKNEIEKIKQRFK